MDKIKLDRVLFEFMETMTNKRKYNYELFISNLADTVECFDYELYREASELAELEPYFGKDKKEETLEKLLKAYIFGYEEENKYTIVLFEQGGCELVLWEIDDDYIIDTKDGFIDDNESAKSSFTRAEISNKFPRLWPLAQKR